MNNDERVISLSDLFSVLLRNIVPIICVTLAFTLLGFSYSSRKSRSASIPPVSQLQQEDLVKAEERRDILANANEIAAGEIEFLEEEELTSLWKSVAAANHNLAQLADYCSSSPVMAMDPFHCTVFDVSLLARTNGNGNNNSVYNVGDQAAAAISSICTMDNSVLEKVRELLGVEKDLDHVRQLICVFNDQDVVHIRLYCANTESAQSVVDYLCRTVTDRIRSGNLGFSVDEISRYNGTVVDSIVREKQILTMDELSKTILTLTDAEAALTGLNSTIDKLHTASSDLASKYASSEQEVATIRAALTQTSMPTASRGISLKTIFLFFILGLFISCFAVVCLWLLSGKFTSQNELLSRYAFPVLGVLPEGKKKLFGNTIRRLEGVGGASFEETAKVVAQTLFRVTENRSACFVSSLGGEKAAALLPYLDGKISVCGDILNDPEAIKDLDKYDSIILVEQKRKSVLSQIDSQVLRAKAFGKEILGIVLI